MSCYVPLNRKGKAVQPFCLLMSLGQFGRMCFNCSTTFSLIGAFVNLCIPTFFLEKLFVSNKGFFSVGNNLCSLLNSFYLISSIITSFTIGIRRSYFGVTCEFYSHLLLDWSSWSFDLFERYLLLLATGSLRTTSIFNYNAFELRISLISVNIMSSIIFPYQA